jgi:hypothetical protein
MGTTKAANAAPHNAKVNIGVALSKMVIVDAAAAVVPAATFTVNPMIRIFFVAFAGHITVAPAAPVGASVTNLFGVLNVSYAVPLSTYCAALTNNDPAVQLAIE